LKDEYNDPSSPAGFSSLERLYQRVKEKFPNLTRKKVEKFLEKNRTYGLFKQRRINFKRFYSSFLNNIIVFSSKFIPSGFLTHLHTDLGDFQKLAKENDGFRYLLVAVDLLSRRLFTAPVKSKESKDMIDAFKVIFTQMPYLPQEIFSGAFHYYF